VPIVPKLLRCNARGGEEGGREQMSHEPWKSRQDISIEAVLEDNLRLRQKYNKLEHDLMRQLLKSESKREIAEKKLRELKDDYNILLQDYVKLRQSTK
jgi:hypothetical protein